MGEEFHALIEHVEYKLLVKKIMGLEVQWKDKQQQKCMNSSTRRWQPRKKPLLLIWNTLHGGGILCIIS
jgi:hypothetical protein